MPQYQPNGKAGLQPRIDAFNAALPGVVRDLQSEGKHVLAVDMSRVLVGDGLENDAHPTDAGYAKMADAWYVAVRQADAKGWIQAPLPEQPATGCDPSAPGQAARSSPNSMATSAPTTFKSPRTAASAHR